MTVLLPGDLCCKHENGAVFKVGDSPDDAMKEQPRADEHEISPTGPMFGWKMTEAGALARIMEESALKDSGLTLESFRGPFGAHGARRPLRFFAREPQVETGKDERGAFMQVAFTLPSGCYATVLLGEIMKEDVTID
jgi:tRNA pseudouridine13 synthase